MGLIQTFRPRLYLIHLLIGLYYSACNEADSMAKFPYSMNNVSAERGQDVTFTCVIENLHKNKVAFLKVDPLALLTMQHKVFAGKSNKYRIENRRDVTKDFWSLTIMNVQNEDQGGYICQIDRDAQMSQTAYLNLKVPPTIDSTLSSHYAFVKEHDNVTLTCVATGSPKPEISWKRLDNQMIYDDPKYDKGADVVVSVNLSLMRVTRKQMGHYICLADNGILPSDGWTVKLHVNCEKISFALTIAYTRGIETICPKFVSIRRSQEKIIIFVVSSISKHYKTWLKLEVAPEIRPVKNKLEIRPGATAELKCHVSGYPRPTTLWLFADKPISPTVDELLLDVDEKSNDYIANNNRKIMKKVKRQRKSSEINAIADEKISNEFACEFMDILTIENLSSGDYGAYTCLAENAYGKAESKIEIIETPRKLDDFPAARDQINSRQMDRLLYRHQDDRRANAQTPALSNLNEKTLETKLLMKNNGIQRLMNTFALGFILFLILFCIIV